MNHPKPEDWIPWLCNEAPPETTGRLQEHLAQCPECAQEISAWQRVAQRLEHWDGPVQTKAGILAWFPPALKWAAAALVVLGAGIGIGRLTAPAAPDFHRLRADLAASIAPMIASQVAENLRQKLDRDVVTALAAAPTDLTNQFQVDLRAAFDDAAAQGWSTAGAEFQRRFAAWTAAQNSVREGEARATTALVEGLRRQTWTELVALRRDLETVATHTSDRIVQANQQLYRLAASQTVNDGHN
jgi:hypothetical protein